jgi:hypothetical protein
MMTDRNCAYDQYDILHPLTRPMNALTGFLQNRIVSPLLVLGELAGSALKALPSPYSRFAFRRFWGPSLLTSDSFFVIDSYENFRLRSGFRSISRYDLGEPNNGIASSELIHGTFSPQAAAMLAVLFLKHAGKELRIATDTEIGHKMDATLICYGTSDSNFKTFDIEVSSENDLCQFSFDGNGKRAFRMGGQLYSLENRGGITYDKAILMRLASPQGSDHCHVVCAGLSEWGSLAAVHYLTKNWKELHKRFDHFGQRRDFCVLLEVPCGQFQCATEIASSVRWTSTRMRPSGRVPALVRGR